MNLSTPGLGGSPKLTITGGPKEDPFACYDFDKTKAIFIGRWVSHGTDSRASLGMQAHLNILAGKPATTGLSPYHAAQYEKWQGNEVACDSMLSWKISGESVPSDPNDGRFAHFMRRVQAETLVQWDALYPNGKSLYRGLSDDEAENTLSHLKVGDMVELRPILSTSSDRNVASDFANNTLGPPKETINIIEVRGARGSTILSSHLTEPKLFEFHARQKEVLVIGSRDWKLVDISERFTQIDAHIGPWGAQVSSQDVVVKTWVISAD
jgi:hypothetical protein